MTDPILHGHWRSSAAYRVRIALNLKGVAYSQVGHDLRTDAQHDPAYLALAPHGLVPALEVDGETLIESPAILEWIEARWPDPQLIPTDPFAAARARAMAALIACDIHPLNNLRVLNYLREPLGASKEQVTAWVAHWIEEGFAALEQLIARDGGVYAFGDTPTIADCCLVPQIYNATRFTVDLSPYPRLIAAGERAAAHPAIAAAHPSRQPDADG